MIDWGTFWSVFGIFVVGGFITVVVGEAYVAARSKGDSATVGTMERQEFADARPARAQVVVRRTSPRAQMVRMPPFVVKDEDSTEPLKRLLQLDTTEALELWLKPPTIYKSANGWDHEPARREPEES